MAITGQAEARRASAVNRTRPTRDWTEVDDVPFAPSELVKLPRRPGGWPAMTPRLWSVWPTMPHAKL